MNKNLIAEIFISIIVAVIGIAMFGIGIWVGGWIGFNKHERVECLKWEKEAKEYPQYYILEWQNEQCSKYDIKIDALVK